MLLFVVWNIIEIRDLIQRHMNNIGNETAIVRCGDLAILAKDEENLTKI